MYFFWKVGKKTDEVQKAVHGVEEKVEKLRAIHAEKTKVL